MKTKEYVSWQELVRDILVEEFMNDKHKAKGKWYMGISNVLKAVFAEKQKQQVSAQDEYRSLLHKYADDEKNVTSADTKRFSELLSTLGKNEIQAQADADIVRKWHEATILASLKEQRQ